MLTQTSELALRALILIGLDESAEPLSPRRMSERLGCSPSYLAKTLGSLVRAGILRSVRGVHGGVMLARTPDKINLLSIVEAVQGIVSGNQCQGIGAKTSVCAYHQVMEKIHQDTINTLSKWTLGALLRCPAPEKSDGSGGNCKMRFLGVEASAPSRAQRVGTTGA